MVGGGIGKKEWPVVPRPITSFYLLRQSAPQMPNPILRERVRSWRLETPVWGKARWWVFSKPDKVRVCSLGQSGLCGVGGFHQGTAMEESTEKRGVEWSGIEMVAVTSRAETRWMRICARLDIFFFGRGFEIFRIFLA